MNRRTGYGLGLTLMGISSGAAIAFEPGYYAIAMGVAGACLSGLGIAVLVGRVEPNVPDEEFDDVPGRFLVVLSAIGILALAVLAALLLVE